jgi:hypothetical protein
LSSQEAESDFVWRSQRQPCITSSLRSERLETPLNF